MAKASKGQGQTARQLVEYLLASGTPSEVLQGTVKWLEAEEEGEREPNAEAGYSRLLEDAAAGVVTLGTLRKAGKWTFGDAFEPQTGDQRQATEELVTVRGENEQLKRRIEQLSSEKRSLGAQRDLAVKRANELQQQVRALRMGKSPEDLAGLGLDAEEPASVG